MDTRSDSAGIFVRGLATRLLDLVAPVTALLDLLLPMLPALVLP